MFTGPVLEDSDPPYRAIRVPLRSGKVAAFMQDGISPPPPTYSTRAPTSPKTPPPKP
ncbi:hypothetical protein SAZ11_62390 [Streptomyces sp. FXJ1.4098]|nr:hypothetical protein [Streptomyces sp. FXJ1.4098]